MTIGSRRRDVLKGALALAGVVAVGPTFRASVAQGAPFEVPTIDRLAVRVILDSSHDIFLVPNKLTDVAVERAPRFADFRRALHNQWGLSLLLEFEPRERTALRAARFRLHWRCAAQ